jgi:hypothetical protein
MSEKKVKPKKQSFRSSYSYDTDSDYSDDEPRPIYRIPPPTTLCDECKRGKKCMGCWDCPKCCRLALQALEHLHTEFPREKGAFCKIHKKDVEGDTWESYRTCYYCARLLQDVWPPIDIIRRALE